MNLEMSVWDLSIETPIGVQEVVLHLDRDDEGWVGSATRGDECVPLKDVVLKGNTLTWTQHVTRPLRLTLRFEVHLDGDALQGHAKPGIFPASRVSGTRRHGCAPKV